LATLVKAEEEIARKQRCNPILPASATPDRLQDARKVELEALPLKIRPRELLSPVFGVNKIPTQHMRPRLLFGGWLFA
jgi:hypothetical protein